MLDENLPTFFIKPSSEHEYQSTIYLGQGGHDLSPEYTLRRPDPSLPASKNCYALALYDSYNPEVLFAEVLVRPEWTQPTLSQAEIRANNGITPPPVPIVPNSFAIQLYNPDQQVLIRQIAGSWNSSAYWEFEMPQHTFRVPSKSSLDRSQSDPAASDTTPRIAFKWKRDGKLSKDITCFLAGKSTDGKKSKEPDITVAMFKHGKELTVYQPNMHRVEVEDIKGLEVVILLGAAAIKDVFFNASRDMFNISSPPMATTRKNSGGLPLLGGRTTTSPPLASGGLPAPMAAPVPASQILPQRDPQPYASTYSERPPPTDPRTQWEIDAETARLRALVEAEEKERERAERQEQKRIKKMLEEEEKERKRRDAEVAKETERLRKQYGVEPVPDNFQPSNHRVQNNPPMPPRPTAQQNQNPPQQPPRHSWFSSSKPSQQQQQQQFPQYLSAPHSQPSPVQRPSSTPNTAATSGPFNQPALHNWWSGPNPNYPPPPPLPQNQNYSHGRRGQSASGPYLQAPDGSNWNASVSQLSGSGADGDGGRKKITKKRSVFF